MVQARTLWDVDIDFDALQEDYCRCLFGAAAGPVRELHESFEQALVEHEPMMKGSAPSSRRGRSPGGRS